MVGSEYARSDVVAARTRRCSAVPNRSGCHHADVHNTVPATSSTASA